MDWIKKLLVAFWAALGSALADKPAPTPDPAPPPAPTPEPPAPPTDPDDPPIPADPPEPPDQPDSQTFVWKPVSDGDSMLAIITPAKYQFNEVTVKYGAGRKKSEKGRYTGRGNGNRQHWRFLKPGKSYGKDIRVVAEGLMDNRTWGIKDGKNRVEGH